MSRISINDINSQLHEQNWILISETYKNLDEELEYECPEGHRVFMPWRKMRNNPVCPICEQNIYKDMPKKTLAKKTDTLRILALDQATRVTGWSIYDGEELVNYGVYEAPEGEDIYRFNAIKEWLYSMVSNWKPDHIGLEGIQYQQNFGVTTFETLARLQGILMEAAYELKIPFTICPTNTWRHACGVKGKSRADKKKSMQLLVKKWFDVSVTNDESDAIGIGKYLTTVIQPTKIIEWG